MHPSSATTASNELADLIGKIATGDRAALARLHRVASSRMIAVAYGVVRRREVAEEVVQDVFLKVWSHAGTFDRSCGSAMGWLSTMTRNRAVDMIRRKADRVVEHRDELPDIAMESDPLFEDGVEPEAALKVVKGLTQLDQERMQMVLLAYLFGWSRDDLARQFDRPVGTVKTWLRRSLVELRAGGGASAMDLNAFAFGGAMSEPASQPAQA